MTDIPTQAPSELKPCPFCGDGAILRDADEQTQFYVVCSSVDCFVALGESYDRDAMPDHSFHSADEAIANWNRRTQAPTDSAVEPAGVSERELLDMTMVRLIAAIGTKRVTIDLAKDAVQRLSVLDRENGALRQQLAEMRGAVQNKLPETLLDAAAIADQRDTLLGLVVVAEELLREAPLPSHKAVDEWIARRDHYLREREAPYSDVLKQMSAPTSQPSRGKCETCNGRQRILQPISKTARNPVKPDELVRVQTFVPCPDCAKPERQGVTFYRCTFEGNPPAPHSNWVDWADSRMYTNVLIMAHEFGLPVPDAFKEKQPERQASPSLREAAKAGAEAMRQLILLSQTMAAPYMGRHSDLVEIERFAALLAAFAEGK